MNDTQTFVAETLDIGKRLDVYLSEELDTTRSQVANLIKSGAVLANKKQVKSGYLVKSGDVVSVTLPEAVTELVPENIPLDILYEDDHIAVTYKPQGLAVHPGGGAQTGTLANALVYRYKTLSSHSGAARPGIVHRLDKDTSGVMVIAKTNEAHLALSTQFANRAVTKTYIAIVEGSPKSNSGEVKTFITRDYKNRKIMRISTFEGKEAVTYYTVLERFEANAYVKFNILTGRTHQIRVHAKHIGHPIVGDKSYGFSKQRFNLSGQLLHAESLTFIHPKTLQSMTFTADPPQEFTRILQLLQSQLTASH